jgi:Pvc16 N-terminal domain
MAGFRAISAAGKSIERVLNTCFDDDEPVDGKNTKALLVQSTDFDPTSGTITFPALSLFLYRVEVNRTMRAAWSAVGALDGRPHLPVDLHFLLTAWADNAEHEYAILGRAMQCLEDTPILGGPLLHAAGEWAPNEVVQVTADDLALDAVMRTFDALEANYRLSVAYLARVVRIDGTPVPDPAVTSVIVGKTPSPVP